jgi:hypothetical protein
LPFAALAVLPALIVGGLVYLLAGGESGGGGGAGLVDSFVRLSTGPDIGSYRNQLPPGFPDEFPLYKGRQPVSSFAIPQDDDGGVSYFVVFSTSDSPQAVYEFFIENLDDDPWQIEASQASDEFTGLLFSRPDDADIEGNIRISRSELDGRTAFFVSLQDLSPSAAIPRPERPEASANRALPTNFPTDIPIYASRREDSKITVTGFERGGGGTSYVVTFLTPDDQDDVIAFYRSEFQKRGWQVTDGDEPIQSFALSIDFQDGPRKEIQGTIRADVSDDDPNYTEVDLLLQVSSSRGRGN